MKLQLFPDDDIWAVEKKKFCELRASNNKEMDWYYYVFWNFKIPKNCFLVLGVTHFEISKFQSLKK